MRVGWARQEAGTNLVKSPERSSSQGFNIGRWLPQHRPLLVRLLLADNFSYCHQILQPDKFSLLRSLSLSLSLRCIQPRPAFPTPLDSKTSAADSYSTGRPNTGNNNDDIVRKERALGSCSNRTPNPRARPSRFGVLRTHQAGQRLYGFVVQS